MGTRFRCHVCLLLCLITGTELAAQTSNWTEIKKRYKLGVEAIQAGHDAEAEEDFRAILRLDPKNASAHANLGSIAFRHANFTEASKEFRAALDLQPTLLNATAFLGMSEFALGKNEEAKPLLESAFEHLQAGKLRSQVGIDLTAVYRASNDLPHAVDIVRALAQAA